MCFDYYCLILFPLLFSFCVFTATSNFNFFTYTNNIILNTLFYFHLMLS